MSPKYTYIVGVPPFWIRQPLRPLFWPWIGWMVFVVPIVPERFVLKAEMLCACTDARTK
jgi:hypothetical protein